MLSLVLWLCRHLFNTALAFCRSYKLTAKPSNASAGFTILVIAVVLNKLSLYVFTLPQGKTIWLLWQQLDKAFDIFNFNFKQQITESYRQGLLEASCVMILLLFEM